MKVAGFFFNLVFGTSQHSKDFWTLTGSTPKILPASVHDQTLLSLNLFLKPFLLEKYGVLTLQPHEQASTFDLRSLISLPALFHLLQKKSGVRIVTPNLNGGGEGGEFGLLECNLREDDILLVPTVKHLSFTSYCQAFALQSVATQFKIVHDSKSANTFYAMASQRFEQAMAIWPEDPFTLVSWAITLAEWADLELHSSKGSETNGFESSLWRKSDEKFRLVLKNLSSSTPNGPDLSQIFSVTSTNPSLPRNGIESTYILSIWAACVMESIDSQLWKLRESLQQTSETMFKDTPLDETETNPLSKIEILPSKSKSKSKGSEEILTELRTAHDAGDVLATYLLACYYSTINEQLCEHYLKLCQEREQLNLSQLIEDMTYTLNKQWFQRLFHLRNSDEDLKMKAFIQKRQMLTRKMLNPSRINACIGNYVES
jgi:hypothetical protein